MIEIIIQVVIILAILPVVMIIFARYIVWIWDLMLAIDRRYRYRKYDRLKAHRDKFMDMKNQARDVKTMADADLAIHRIEKKMQGLLW